MQVTSGGSGSPPIPAGAIVTPLKTAQNVTLDSNGNGVLYFQTDSGSQEWYVQRIAVRTTQTPTQTPFPQAEVFDTDSPTSGSSLGATASGHNDIYDAAGGPIHVGTADTLSVVWTGGIPGTVASATLRGIKVLRRG